MAKEKHERGTTLFSVGMIGNVNHGNRTLAEAVSLCGGSLDGAPVGVLGWGVTDSCHGQCEGENEDVECAATFKDEDYVKK